MITGVGKNTLYTYLVMSLLTSMKEPCTRHLFYYELGIDTSKEQISIKM